MKDNNKLETISNLFEGKEIRSVWDSKKEEYYFSVVNVIGALTDSNNPRNCWNMLKKIMTEEEKSELYSKCVQLKMKAKDGKIRETDTLDTEGILRLIESVPSSKAEPIKLWLAQMGKERIDEIFDPELAINRAIDYYRNKGYSDRWIEARLKGILDRKKLNYKYVEETKMLNKSDKIVKKAGCILINQESKKVALINTDGIYSFPKGHLEKNETIMECAIRETKEETGHDCKIIGNEPISIIHYISRLGENTECYFYLAVDNGITKDTLNEEDKEETVWVNYDDVEITLSPNNLKELWNEIKEKVEKIIKN